MLNPPVEPRATAQLCDDALQFVTTVAFTLSSLVNCDYKTLISVAVWFLLLFLCPALGSGRWLIKQAVHLFLRRFGK